MQPFQDLVKTKTTFSWNATLDQLFNESKSLLISKVEEGIKCFDIKNAHAYKQIGAKMALAIYSYNSIVPAHLLMPPHVARMVGTSYLLGHDSQLKQRVGTHQQKESVWQFLGVLTMYTCLS